MRDDGLDEAIRVAGGVGALARKIGISQPSVSNWARIPAERVLSVETATGVNRTILRPDLYGGDQALGGDIDVDAGRAQEYGLLSVLLARAPDRALLERLATLRGDASPLGLAHAALAEAASRTTSERVEREYFDLFIGLGRGELLPYASYYLTGFLNERPLARLRDDLAQCGIDIFGHAAGITANKEVRAFTIHPFPNFIRALQHFVLDVGFFGGIARPGEIEPRQKSVAFHFLKFVVVKIIAVFVLRSEEEPVFSFCTGRFALL